MSDEVAENSKNIFIRNHKASLEELVHSPNYDTKRGNAAALMTIAIIILKDIHGYSTTSTLLLMMEKELRRRGALP